MPLYEFQCAKCQRRFEIVSNHADRDHKAVCPDCGSRDVTPVFGAFRVGISRTKLNPGTFERKKGQAPTYKPPAKG
jgi:putative FmdB family regulatory protein